MSIDTYFRFLNQNDPNYLAALNDEQLLEEWEDEHGPTHLSPGAEIDGDFPCIEQTEEEYGGWLVDLSKVPKNATHLLIYNS